MAKTKSSLYATKEDVREIVTDIVTQASDAILSGMDEILKNLATKDDFNKLQTDVSEIKSQTHFLTDDLRNIEADVSILPTRSEFNKLKQEVNLIQNV